MRFIGIALGGCLTLFAANFAAASIQVSSSIATSDAVDGDFASNVANGEITIPLTASVNAIAGDPLEHQSFAKMGINWSLAGGQTVLDFSFDHHRSGILPSLASSKEAVLHFLALDDEPYALAGFYHVFNPGPDETGHSLFRVLLFDVLTMTNLSFTEGESHDTSNAEYEVVPATGNLIAGHEYILAFEALIENNQGDDDAGANATGRVTLTIGPTGAVPEPASLLVWGGIATAVGAAVCRRTPH
jgi:hypothetical protein